MALTKNQFIETWEGNRRLTVRTIEAFPEKDLFSYSPIEPLRPFAKMVSEILNIEDVYLRGIARGKWEWKDAFGHLTNKAGMLQTCEKLTGKALELWQEITEERLDTVEKDPFFGGEQRHFSRLQYALENEIHHRGQGFVYLRMLGIEPPAFYER